MNNSLPYQGGAAVTPADDGALKFNGLFVGGAGNIKIDCADGRTLTLTGVAAGSVLQIAGTRVYSTGTTATNIAALI